jgi:hypothetical protein
VLADHGFNIFELVSEYQAQVEIQYFSKHRKDSGKMTVVDKIIVICCALVSLCEPIVPFE